MVYMMAIMMIIVATMGTPIMPAMTGIKNPAACMSSLTKSLVEGKDRLCFLPSIMGKMPVSFPLTTLSAFTLMMKSGLKPIFRMPGMKMQRLFRSSATTMQSWGSKPSLFRMSQRIFSLPFLVMASPQILPVNLPSFCFNFNTVSVVGAK